MIIHTIFNWYFKDKIRIILYTPIILVTLFKCVTLLVNTPSGEDLFTDKRKKDLLQRRAYLIDQLDRGNFASDSMPDIGGKQFQYEWGLVNASMTAMALTNLAFRYPETHESANIHLKSLVELVISDDYRGLGELTWDKDPLADLDTSITQTWYISHVGITLAAYKFCSGSTEYDSLYRAIHHNIVRNIQKSDCPYLQTYPAEVYSADNSTLYASLKLYEQIMKEDFTPLFEDFISYTKEHELDDRGLIKSYIGREDSPSTNSRGSWLGWISNFLPIVDSTFAREQYELSKEHFFDTFCGVTIFREYPKGVEEAGDIDSGPVIFGASTSGTAFIIGGAVRQRDYKKIGQLIFTAELMGNSISWGGKKHYFSAPLVGDAAMLAMMTGCHWDLRYQQ